MGPLKDALAECVTELWAAPKAIIVDDELNADDGRSLVDWIELTEVLRGEPKFFNQFERFLNDKGHKIDAPPSPELWNQLKTVIAFPEDEPLCSALQRYEEREQVVSQLAACLEEIGFSIKCYPAKPKAADVLPANLFLVDYQLIPEAEEGDSARTLFEELMASSATTGVPPPIVILMSKKPELSDVKKWEDVGRQAGYYRCNFDFLSKSDFETDPAVFSLSLINLLQHKPVADAYYQQLTVCASEAQSTAKSLLKDLFQVTPSEARMFQAKLADEGTSLAQVSLNLFSAHLARRVARSAAVRERMSEFEKAVATSGILAPHRSHRLVLYRLYADLLFEICTAGDASPPSFGDVYITEDDVHLVVLSQECDIKVRGDGRPKKERILSIEGNLRNVPLSSNDATSIRCLPVLQADDSLLWLHLDTAKPRIVSFDDLMGESFRKGLRMDADYAEDLRHAFVTQLTRVGLDLLPDFVTHITCVLYSERQERLLSGDVGLYKLGEFPDAYLAFSTDTKALYAGLGEFPFIAPEDILELSCFHKAPDFFSKLQKLRIVVRIHVTQNKLVLCKTQSGSASEKTEQWLSAQEYVGWQ